MPLYSLKYNNQRLNRCNRGLVLVTNWSKELIMIEDCRVPLDAGAHGAAHPQQASRSSQRTFALGRTMGTRKHNAGRGAVFQRLVFPSCHKKILMYVPLLGKPQALSSLLSSLRRPCCRTVLQPWHPSIRESGQSTRPQHR